MSGWFRWYKQGIDICGHRRGADSYFWQCGYSISAHEGFPGFAAVFSDTGYLFYCGSADGAAQKVTHRKKRNEIRRKDLQLHGEYGVYGQRQIPGECDRALF